jgi:tagatose 6-phosphate kinase
MQRSMTFAKLTLNEVNRTARVYEYASGKSTNAARVLHTLGEQPIATGFLGGDRGDSFRSDLDLCGIKHDFVTVAPRTRLCTTVIDQSAGTATELLEESQPVPAADYELLLEKLKTLLDRAKLLILSGNLPPGANSDFYAQCVQLAGDTVRVIVDAVGQPLMETLKFQPFVIKPNQSEVGRTLGVDVSDETKLKDAMGQLLSRGAQWVIVTRGTSPALITNGQAFWQITIPHVKSISPIGSGDAFAAGLAAGLMTGKEVPEASLLATACGCANAMTPDAGHLNRESVCELTQKINIDRLG